MRTAHFSRRRGLRGRGRNASPRSGPDSTSVSVSSKPCSRRMQSAPPRVSRPVGRGAERATGGRCTGLASGWDAFNTRWQGAPRTARRAQAPPLGAGPRVARAPRCELSARGRSRQAGGNEMATWDGDGMLRIRLLRTEEVTHLTLAGVRLPKRYLLAAHTALAYRQPLSWRVTLLPGLRVKLALSFEEWQPRITSRIEHGAVALDLNADHAAIIDVTGDGRPGRATRLPVGEGPQSTLDIAHAVAERARERQCPVVIEDLDFRLKRSWAQTLWQTVRTDSERVQVGRGGRGHRAGLRTRRRRGHPGRPGVHIAARQARVPSTTQTRAPPCGSARHRASGLGVCRTSSTWRPCRPRPTEVSGRGSGGRRIRCLQWLAAVQPRRRSARRRAATAAPGPPRARAGPRAPDWWSTLGAVQPLCRWRGASTQGRAVARPVSTSITNGTNERQDSARRGRGAMGPAACVIN